MWLPCVFSHTQSHPFHSETSVPQHFRWSIIGAEEMAQQLGERILLFTGDPSTGSSAHVSSCLCPGLPAAQLYLPLGIGCDLELMAQTPGADEKCSSKLI